MRTTPEIIPDLQAAKNARDAALSKLDGYTVELALRAMALEPPPPSEPPPEEPPPPVVVDPPNVADYGVGQDVPLTLYHWKPVSGAQPSLESGKTLERIHIRGDGKDGSLDVVGDGATWENALLIPKLGTGHLDDWTLRDSLLTNGDLWGIRTWKDVIRRNGRIVGVTIRNIWNEHGGYFNVAGYGHAAMADALLVPCLLIEDVLIEDIGSQGLQFVQRDSGAADYETADATQDYTPGGPIEVFGVLLRDVGHTTGSAVPGGRPSFSYSFAPSRNPINMTDAHLDNSLHGFSRGALLFEGYAPGSVAGSPHATNGYERRVTVYGGSFRTGGLEQPMLQARDIASLEIVGAHFEAKGGQDWFNITGPGKVTISDCTGTTRLHYNGQDVGPVSAGFKTSI